MHFADQGGVLALIRLLLGRGESGHPPSLGILPHLKHCCLSILMESFLMAVKFCGANWTGTKMKTLRQPTVVGDGAVLKTLVLVSSCNHWTLSWLMVKCMSAMLVLSLCFSTRILIVDIAIKHFFTCHVRFFIILTLQ